MSIQNLLIPGPDGDLSVRVKAPSRASAGAVVLVQGSNLTGQSMFDFSFPGGDDYSLMDQIVALGFTAVTFAIRGYGASTLSGDPFGVTTEAAIEDLAAVMAWTIGQGHHRPHLLGFSWGGRIAGRYVETHGDTVDRLILYDPARGGGNVVLPAPGPGDGWWINSPDFYLEKFEPQHTAADLRAALATHVVAHDARAPNGIRLENATPVTAIRPGEIRRPTLLVYGIDAAKASYMQGGVSRADFFEQLATDDKSFVILPGGGDFLHFQHGRHRLFQTIADFLAAPGA
ncbi:alpha/beta hydrolase [Sphingomonas immobilis]|uniref:Alpha/beta fold hydrolase n=1 Tax=Sphingomonas immobilis TaxID=3063997 RepID=A0ABT9A0M7_9SPHN|nr:alpha/beta fold hydrolase [Sphingomonas sp. CA1-15]MDO7843388.1 alpha/beta fold hydrolase [Sphingomonas sp. CA1-15]